MVGNSPAKVETHAGYAKARAWAMKRRDERAQNAADRKKEGIRGLIASRKGRDEKIDFKATTNRDALKRMLKKEEEILLETQLKVELIKKALKKYK